MEPLCKLFSPLVDLKVGTLGEDDGLLLLILTGGLLDTQSVPLRLFQLSYWV